MREKRLEANLTMAQMAEKLDITESYYSLIEAGQRQKDMDISLAVNLAKIFSIPTIQIVEYEKEGERKWQKKS